MNKPMHPIRRKIEAAKVFKSYEDLLVKTATGINEQFPDSQQATTREKYLLTVVGYLTAGGAEVLRRVRDNGQY